LFQRGSSSRGTGMGLYLVRVLMERMGGSVKFAQAPGGGFEARLSFKASPA
jgi:signal transduction histidine kinase